MTDHDDPYADWTLDDKLDDWRDLRAEADARKAGPSVATLVALAQTFEANESEAADCSGGSYTIEDGTGADGPAPIDADEAENYGAAQAWGLAAKAVRTALGERAGGQPFDRSAMLQTAMGLLRAIVQVEGGEGSGSIVGDACLDALTVLVEATTEEGSPAVDLLDTARRLVDAAIDGRSGAVGSLIVWVERDNGQVALEAREVARAVNALYGDARRVR